MSKLSILSQFIGLALSLAQLSIAASQAFCYYQTFPHDKRLLKYLVAILLVLTTSATVLSCIMFWSFFTSCNQRASPECLLWERAAVILLFLTAANQFIVQSLYCHRVWIISGGNIYITMPITLLAASVFAMGLAIIPPQIHKAFVHQPLKLGNLRSLLSAICDCLISISVYFYLRSSKSGVRRMDNRIQSIVNGFISMCVITSLLAIFLFVLYWIHESAVIGGAIMLLRNSYANSLLTILNARKPLKESVEMDVELPTIHTHTEVIHL